MALLHVSGEADVLELFEHAGRIVRRATALLRDLLADWPDSAALAGELTGCERESDLLGRDIVRRLHDGRARGRALDPHDGHRLAAALDDVVGAAEHVADLLGVYRVEAAMEGAWLLGDVVAAAGDQVCAAVRALRAGGDVEPHLVEIHRLENAGDRLSRDAIASLFVAGIDPMVVIRWKDIFAALEAACDACERAAHVLEGVALRRRRAGR